MVVPLSFVYPLPRELNTQLNSVDLPKLFLRPPGPIIGKLLLFT